MFNTALPLVGGTRMPATQRGAAKRQSGGTEFELEKSAFGKTGSRRGQPAAFAVL
jgi:hypothetical protein